MSTLHSELQGQLYTLQSVTIYTGGIPHLPCVIWPISENRL